MGVRERWILDDGVLGALAERVSPETVAGWPAGAFLVADATAHDARRDRSGRRSELLGRGSEGSESPFEVFRVEMTDEAGRILYEHLRKEETVPNANLAEHESIAWALVHDENAVFVTIDRRAALTALAELGRKRVAHAFDLWTFLHGEGWIDDGTYRDLLRWTVFKDQGLAGIPWRLRGAEEGKKRHERF